MGRNRFIHRKETSWRTMPEAFFMIIPTQWCENRGYQSSRHTVDSTEVDGNVDTGINMLKVNSTQINTDQKH